MEKLPLSSTLPSAVTIISSTPPSSGYTLTALVEMYQKDLTKVTNPKHFRILSDIQCITFHEVTYILGEANILADALSRLCKHLRVEGRELENVKPRILGLSTSKARRARQLMQQDPLVVNLAQM